MQSQLCGNHGQFVEAPISDIEEASAFPDVSASVTCRVSFAEITGSLSKWFSRRVSICHMQSQLCRNHVQFVEAPILDIEEALVFPDVSAPVTCTQPCENYGQSVEDLL
ncbi:hypothetical protein ACFX15_042980 [Malus domestica]